MERPGYFGQFGGAFIPEILVATHHNMIADWDIQDAASLDQLARHRSVIRRWRRIATRMVVYYHDPRSGLRDRRPEHLAWVHE